MKRLPTALTLMLLAVPACGSDDDAPEETGSTGGEGTDGGGDTNASAPDPTTPTGASDTDTGDSADTGPTTDDSDGSASDTTGETEGDTEGVDPVDPADLPFGGYVTWAVQDLFAFGDASFYEVEHPDDEDYEPFDWELPLGDPISEDTWTVFAEQAPPDPNAPPPPQPTKTPFDVGPQLFVEGTDLALTFEYVPDEQKWDMGFVDLEAEYAGGPWTLDIPGNTEFPEETFEDVIVGAAGGAAGLEIVTDDAGVPTQLAWTPLEGAHNVTVFMGAFGPDGAFMPLCAAEIADDGEADIPPACVGMGMVPIPAPMFDTVFFGFGHEFHEDIAYAGHRLRIQTEVNTQVDLPFPFEIQE